jgi:hypothetical protein
MMSDGWMWGNGWGWAGWVLICVVMVLFWAGVIAAGRPACSRRKRARQSSRSGQA